MRIARVFPRRTSATPCDDLAFVGDPPGLFPPEVDEVHISVAFTWDMEEADRLAKEWRHIAPVKIGGPATGEKGLDFEPGRYLKPGYVITSRGCRNRCWFCSVWRREGDIRELPIRDGWNVLDDNLLATSWGHFVRVCRMLARQKQKPEFTGGLEAAILSRLPLSIRIFPPDYASLPFVISRSKIGFRKLDNVVQVGSATSFYSKLYLQTLPPG